MQTYTYTQIYVCICVYIYIYMYVYISLSLSLYIYIYIYTYIHALVRYITSYHTISYHITLQTYETSKPLMVQLDKTERLVTSVTDL